jgi:threonine aldolase
MNAVVASGRPAHEHARSWDSVWVDLSKGLGCPVGAVLVGSAEFVDAAWRLKQQWGGAMRQSGILAAAGLYALDHHVERLADDHARAKRIADALRGLSSVSWVSEVETNILFFDVAPGGPTLDRLHAALAARGIDAGQGEGRRMRLVTHLDVDDDAVDTLVAVLPETLG